ncbi:MAG: chromosome segregation protein [Bacillota bacterium]
MYLERLKLIGFKSFPDRTELKFSPGITAIVGPNGSGKSNIVDALRWVLGEQSARTLRGQRMEEIIFSGSKGRKALGYSEVEVIFNNSQDVMQQQESALAIKRRIYRSLESEYQLNGIACRLRDIQELLLDTGIGQDAYSFIGQGRIDQILSEKLETKRELFDEVAGIVKHRLHKDEALAKLKSTDEHLLRVEDLLAELDRQHTHLREQARQAKIYTDLQERLKTLEINLLKYKLCTTKHQLKKEQDNMQAKKVQQLIVEDQLSNEFELNKKIKIELIEKKKEHLIAQQNLVAITQKLERVLGEERLAAERVKNQQQLEAELSTSEQELEKEIRMQELRIKELDNIYQECRSKEFQLEKQLVELKQRLKTEDQQKNLELSELIRQLDEMKVLLANRKQLKIHITSQLQEQSKKLVALKEEKVLTNQRWQTQLINQEEAQAIFEKKNNTLCSLKNSLAIKEEEVNQLHKKHDTKKAEVLELAGDLRQALDKQRLLASMQQAGEGFAEGVRAVLKQQHADCYGTVAQLISVPAEYTLAIQVALGGQFQHLVVKEAATAKNLIAYLRKEKIGRATFLPLTVIKPRLLKAEDVTECKKIAGFIDLAAALVVAETSYETLVRYLLGQVVVMQDLPSAIALAKATSYRHRLVTLKGDFINTGGAMTGGSIVSRSTSVFQRQAATQEITTLIKLLENKQATLQAEETNLNQELALLIEEKQQLTQRICSEEQELLERQLTCRTLNQELSLLDLALAKETEQEQELSAKIAELQSENDSINQEIIEFEQAIPKVDRKIQSGQKEGTLQLAQLTKADTKLQVEYAKSREQAKHSAEEAKYLKTKLAALQEKQVLLQNRKQGLNLKKLLTECGNLTEQIGQLSATKKEMEHRAKESERTESELLHEQEEARIKIRTLEQEEAEIKLAKQHAALKSEELEKKFTEQQAELFKEYQLEFKQHDELAAEINPKTCQRKIEQVKRQLQELGSVNMAATAEYSKVKNRVASLKDQVHDLRAARIKFFSIIENLDQVMITTFKKSFTAIKLAYRETFAKLFGGGLGDVKLSDPSDILGSNIDIIVQPPGKRRQKLALFSGGERALAAIALLFAVLQAKPVPFCVLDEVDAALDEANLGRFMQYLRGYADKTQFLLVTHRRKTMERADIMYGITMPADQGVSQVASLNLKALARV